ncbi:hypothetical protein CHS0354_013449 [Potamilus streckersoni]|uniref:VWFA domain-containing protein n=1 Tax=Potamilus streckersoni TaxID=2493646 RepID=A0AAE0RYR5_9BIVA|nr:hypothetical protein CHS0354_013449 [Potamilus streckersoni]
MDIRQVILFVLAVVAGVQSRPGVSEVCSQAADIVFVLDSSTSIWIEDFKRQLTFVQDVVKMFDVGQGPTQARVGILTFGNKVWIDYTLDKFSDVESLINAVEKIPHKAGTTTNTWEALDTLRTQMFTPEMGSRVNVSHIAIVITDGRSQKTMRTKVSAEAVHDAGINMFAIGVGHNIDFVELGYIATDPDEGFLFNVDNYTALESIKGIIADKTCQVTQKPVIPPSITPTTKSQSNRNDVVTVTQIEAILQNTTSLPKPQGDQDPEVTNCGSKPADIYFVIDSSASIGVNNFKQVLHFVKDIASIFDIGKEKTRVGLLTFSHDVQNEILLNNRFTKEELLKIIVDIKYTVGGTNTGKALEFVRTVGFSNETARPGVAHVAIVVTDGMSKNPIDTARQAELAHKAGINTFAIGVGDYVDIQELRDIASNPDNDYVFQVNDFHSLDSIKKLLAMRTCDIKPNDPPVDIRGDNMYVCTPAVETDLLFTYDSVAIGSWKSQTISQFIGALVNGFERNGLVRVGRLTSDCQRSGNIALTQELSNVAFSKLEFTTFTHLIRKVRRHGFSVEQGGRTDARRIVVMVVDEELEDVNSEMIGEAQNLNKEAEVYVIVIGKGNNLPLVHELTMVKGEVDQGHIINVDSYQKIFSVKEELLGRLCRSKSSIEITRDLPEVDNDEDYYESIPKPV